MPTLTETMLRPKPGFGKAALLLLIAAIVAFAASVVLAFVRGQLTVQSVPDLLLGAIVVLAVVAAVVLENKRAHSIELTTEAATALSWKFALGFLPYQLVPVRIRWDELPQVAHKGFSVNLRGIQGEISINTYLFSDPAKVIDFINRQTSSK